MISDAEYNKYVKYFGKLNALPKEQLDRFDTTDHFRNQLPITQWPTKSTRENSRKIWDNYNKEIQSSVSMGSGEAQDVEKKLDELYYKCVISSKWPREVAQKKCKEQIEKFREHLRTVSKDSDEVEDFVKKIDDIFKK